MTEYIILFSQIIGTIAFAISGAVIAINNKLDMFGVISLGFISAIGGGITRDILIGDIPPDAFINPFYSIIAIFTSVIVFIFFYFIKETKLTKKPYKTILNIIDAIGLGFFTVVGATIIINKGHINIFLVVFGATITAVGGGIIRDLLTSQIPVIFIRHIYALASLIGSIIFYIAYYLYLSLNIAIFLGALCTIAIRLLACHYNLSLPSIKK